jgi:DEAD/DEAH box helicase domain-containing protein
MDMFDFLEKKENNKNEKIIYFDLETQRSADEVGWNNIDLMYMSIGVAYVEPDNEYKIYTEEKINELLDLLFSADFLVTFNGKRFDNLVLSHYTEKNVQEIPMVDMFLDVCESLGRDRGPGLDNIARATLKCEGKNANPLDVFDWYKNNEFDKIIYYCKNDVEMTKNIYHYGKEKGNIFAYNRNDKLIPINVSWKIRTN